MDEYTDDYNSLNRPANYSSSYKPSYDPVDKSGGGGAGYYRQPYSQPGAGGGGPSRFQANYGAFGNMGSYGQMPDPYSNNGGSNSTYGYQTRFGGGGANNSYQQGNRMNMMTSNYNNMQMTQDIDG